MWPDAGHDVVWMSSPAHHSAVSPFASAYLIDVNLTLHLKTGPRPGRTGVQAVEPFVAPIRFWLHVWRYLLGYATEGYKNTPISYVAKHSVSRHLIHLSTCSSATSRCGGRHVASRPNLPFLTLYHCRSTRARTRTRRSTQFERCAPGAGRSPPQPEKRLLRAPVLRQASRMVS